MTGQTTSAMDAQQRIAANPEIAALEGAATRIATPCGAGVMVWRRWGAGPPLVLLHGGHGSWTHWLRSIPALSARFTVLVPDLPGMGDSDMPADPPSLAGVAKAIARGLDRVIDGPVPVRLVGFSFGATVAAYMLPVCGDRIAQLVLVGSAAGGPVNPVSQRLIPWRDEPDPERRRALHRHNLGVLMLAHPDSLDDLAVDLHMVNAERTRLRSRPLHRGADLAAQLRLAPPRRLAALWGARDALLQGHDDVRTQRLRALDPDAKVMILPDAGHWLQHEAAGRATTALLSLLR